MIDKNRGGDDVNFEKLRGEAEILKELHHPNIIKLYNVKHISITFVSNLNMVLFYK